MKLNETKTQFISENGRGIDVSCSDNEIAIKLLVGYHNYFMVGVFDACNYVQEAIDNAGLNYRAGCDATVKMPKNAIRVGQVRVHHGDPRYPLYVVKKQ